MISARHVGGFDSTALLLQSAELAVINTSVLRGDPRHQMSFSAAFSGAFLTILLRSRCSRLAPYGNASYVVVISSDLIWFKISPTPEHFCVIVASALVFSPPTTHEFHCLMLPECYVMGTSFFPKLRKECKKSAETLLRG